MAGRAEITRGGFDMYRSYWELDTLARHRNAEIAAECQRYGPVEAGDGRANTLLTQLRRHLGITLIQLGQALAGQEARRSLPSRPSRPAIWGQPSF
jgi:hypothetical protein